MKNLNNLDLNTLIDIAKKPLQEDNSKVSLNKLESKFMDFIRDNNIVEGKEKISGAIVYDLYLEEMTGKPKLSQRKFFIELGKLFKKVRTNQGICYLLEPSPFEQRTQDVNKEKEVNKK